MERVQNEGQRGGLGGLPYRGLDSYCTLTERKKKKKCKSRDFTASQIDFFFFTSDVESGARGEKGAGPDRER